jgi:hypothetical protein
VIVWEFGEYRNKNCRCWSSGHRRQVQIHLSQLQRPGAHSICLNCSRQTAAPGKAPQFRGGLLTQHVENMRLSKFCTMKITVLIGTSPISGRPRGSMADVNSSAQDRGSIATRAKLLLPMDYPYPEVFPQSSRARVQGESIRAARDFDRAKQEAPSKIPRLLRAYILRVFIAFVREARNLALQGLWSVDRLESESREFLRGFAITARYEKGHDRSGGLVPDMVSHWTASILPEIQRSFEQSPEWQEFQDILLEVADAQASWPERSLPGETVLDDCELKVRTSEQSRVRSEEIDWENITISFLSDERVQVEVGGQVQTRNYAEIGFADKRSGKPNQAWGLLRTLAQAKGVIPNSARKSPEFIAMAKRIERIRKSLRDHFRIGSDPIPLDSTRGYCCRFSIRCAPSFEK